MRPYDIVIVGAGPAGSAAAITARKAGLTTAIIDKALFPRNKLCGGLITGRCARLLREVFDQDTSDDLFELRSVFEFFMEGQRLARMENVPPAHLTMRWDFDHVLLKHAFQHGAEDFTGNRVASLDLDRNQITLQSGDVLSYSCLIGADGVQSIIAKQLYGQSFEKERIGFALEIEAKPQETTADTPVRVDFGAASWGYGWSFPKRKTTTIGIGGLQTENPEIKDRLRNYLALLGQADDAKVKGHFLPFGGYRNRPGRKNVLVCGDAAGFVDPITGEGIGYAIQSGALAAQAASDAIRLDQPEKAFSFYLPATRPIRTALRSAQILRPVIFAARLKPFFTSTFRASRTLKHDYMRLLAGEIEYPSLLGRTFLRLPSAALRHLKRNIRHKNERHT